MKSIKAFLWRFSGEDRYIIEKCEDTKTQNRFAYLGLFVIGIFIGCFISATAFMYEVFEGLGRTVCLPFGIFWGLSVSIIYILLLNTISPTILPLSDKSNKKKHSRKKIEEEFKNALNTSFIFRIGFMFIISIIIAQPLNILLLSKHAAKSFENFKTEYKIKMSLALDENVVKKETELQKDILQKLSLKVNYNDSVLIARNISLLNEKITSDKKFHAFSNSIFDSIQLYKKTSAIKLKSKIDSLYNLLTIAFQDELTGDNSYYTSISAMQFQESRFNNEFVQFKSEMLKILNYKNSNYDITSKLIEKSNFYVKRIQILLFEYPLSWLFTLLMCYIFIFPIIMKFRIRKIGNFYEIKQKIEKEFVLDEYKEFKKAYSMILEERINNINNVCNRRLSDYLVKIKEINPNNYNNLKADIESYYKSEKIEKYEHWADPPFRTTRKDLHKNLPKEKEMFDLFYNDNTI